jgi:hypothetical protein
MRETHFASHFTTNLTMFALWDLTAIVYPVNQDVVETYSVGAMFQRDLLSIFSFLIAISRLLFDNVSIISLSNMFVCKMAEIIVPSACIEVICDLKLHIKIVWSRF